MRITVGGLCFIFLVLCLAFGVGIASAQCPVSPEKEKGSKKCSDGCDNDLDGKIDGADPDCGGDDGGGGGTAAGDFRVTINFDGAVTTVDLINATIDCADNSMNCDISGDTSFVFYIPESYWSQWPLEDARECFNASLNAGEPAQVEGIGIFARDHHGSPGHWDVHVDYEASAIGTQDSKTHHANFQGDCLDEVTGMPITCPDLPPTNGSTNTYNNGDLTRTQVASRGRPFKGDPCTCAWEGCPPLLPTTVTVRDISQ